MKLIIVSGLSGAGKSIALHTLEDMGYYCVDNLPVGLLQAFASEMQSGERSLYENAAVGIDARNCLRDLRHFPDTVQALRKTGLSVEIFFLQAEDETLLKRFSETRRKHPLTGDGLSLADAIRLERELLGPIAANADLILDTTRTHIHQLRDLLRDRARKSAPTLSLLFQSFGYKHGVPSDADFVFDVRCLPNPHWEPELRPLSGLDREVAAFLEKQPLVSQLYEEIRSFLETWIPRFEEDNRSYMTVALGCTGGQHRSVYMAERLARHFRRNRIHVLTRHRELS